MHANDNQPAYFAQEELDRARVLQQRLAMISRQRRRALAAGRRPPPPLGQRPRRSDWHYVPPRRFNGFGILNKYGLAIAATLMLSLGTLHLVRIMIDG